MATVKVAVRVRPFNDRENDLDSELIISMDDKKTRIVNKSIPFGSSQDGVSGREKVKEFSFDYSYWSFDKSDDTYASQEKLFADLGVNVVDSAYEGYNACVFAYGQTGSGKTYTMMGTSEDPGLIPRICESLFKRMHTGKEEGTTYRVEVSYLEIYNEHVKDLLRKGTNTHNLRVREHPKHGPFVQDLSKHLVMDYADIKELMDRGNSVRTTAATKMNDVSSRSHAIFTITFVQAKFHQDLPSETVSKVHLVDLAGSERADASGATGIRLKEGAHINKSLVTLGSVISSLADLSTSTPSEKIRIFIPYRDSVLTWLLKDSLGGNSKTVMLAAISPADVNYGETLSTLRYANRAKNIVNKPTVNEDPNVKLIRELKAEISKLRAMLKGSQNMSNPLQMVERLQENEAKVKVLTEEWTERWLETQKILQEQRALALRKDGLGVVLDSDKPHLVGIDDDVLSTGITLYHLKDGKTRIGNEGSESKQDIILSGPGLQPEHCIIELREGVATLIPVNDSDCYVNTIRIDKPTKLSQGCIILLGRNNRFRYNNPAMAAELRKTDKGGKLNRSRPAFLSCSMPDLAGSVDNNGNISSTQRSNLDTQFEADSLTNFSHDSLLPADIAASKSSDVICESVDLQQPYINELMETGGNNAPSYESEGCNLRDLLQESDKETYFGPLVDLKYLELNDRIVELVEQEVQRRIVEETSERLQQIRERQRDLDIIRGSAFGPVSQTNFRSASLGCLRVFEPQVPQSFSITIPSYMQRGVGYSTHYEFEVRITTTEQAWTVYRRYRRFREFHMEMKQKYGNKIEDIPFPPRSFFRAHSESKIRERQRLLERYLQRLIDKCLQIPECPLSSLDYDSLTCETLCNNFPFFRRGLFEIGKYGTS